MEGKTKLIEIMSEFENAFEWARAIIFDKIGDDKYLNDGVRPGDLISKLDNEVYFDIYRPIAEK